MRATSPLAIVLVAVVELMLTAPPPLHGAAQGVASATRETPIDRVDEFIRAQMVSQRIPALSLAIVKNGQVIKAQGYGVEDLKRKTPATTETVYKIASVSKQFIAAGVMLLAQEGRLTVDDPINQYLDAAPANWQEITIRHALTHTAGLVREAPGFDPYKTQSDEEVIKSAYRVPLNSRPGEKYEYSNLGYFVLGQIISKLSGRSWNDYLFEKAFKPAGMLKTRATHLAAAMAGRATGYSDNDKLQEVREWPASRPSGGFVSTVMDLARWDAVLYTDKVLNESTRQQMWTPFKLNNGSLSNYGFGWRLGSHRGRRLVFHGGGLPGAASEFARFVDDRLTIILLMNLDDVDDETLLYGVADLYLENRRN